MKDWIVYIENNKYQAWDVTREDSIEVRDVLKSLGLEVIGYTVADRYADGAINYIMAL